MLHLFAAVLYARHGRHTFPSSSAASSSSSNHLTAPNTISSSHSAPHPTDSKPNGHSHPPQSSQANVAAPVNGPTQPPPHLPSPSRSTSHPRSPPSPSTSTHHSPPSSSTYPYPPMKSIYITAPNPFPVLESFVLSSADRYGMDLYRFGGGMKAALNEYLGCGGGKGVRGVLVGTRRGDPNGGECRSSEWALQMGIGRLRHCIQILSRSHRLIHRGRHSCGYIRY